MTANAYAYRTDIKPNEEQPLDQAERIAALNAAVRATRQHAAPLRPGPLDPNQLAALETARHADHVARVLETADEFYDWLTAE